MKQQDRQNLMRVGLLARAHEIYSAAHDVCTQKNAYTRDILWYVEVSEILDKALDDVRALGKQSQPTIQRTSKSSGCQTDDDCPDGYICDNTGDCLYPLP